MGPREFPSLSAEMETRTFEVKCYLCSFKCFFFLKLKICAPSSLCFLVRAAGLGSVSVILGSVSLSQRVAGQKLHAQSLSLSFGRDFGHVVQLWESWVQDVFVCVWFTLPSIGRVICCMPHTHALTHILTIV